MSLQSVLNIILTIIAIPTAIHSFFYTVDKDNLEKSNLALTNLKEQVETELKTKEFDNDLKLTIYKEVKDAIEQKKDTQIQNATLIIVNEMLKDDSAFREKLKTLLFASSNSKNLINIQQKLDTFAIADQAITASSKFTIDVFYLEDLLKETKPKANETVSLLRQKFPSYNIRLRLLPSVINAKSGYRIDVNQIRCEKSEMALADDVLKLINGSDIFKKGQKPVLQTINYHTPNYISVFIRNN